MTYQFDGVMTALVTPFDTNGLFDAKAMRRLVEFQIDGGIDGLVVCGSTGEAATLSDEEYVEVVEAVVGAVAGRVPVIAGAGSNNTNRAIELSKLAESAGVNGLLHVSPFYNKPSTAGLLAHYRAIAESVTLPIIIYNVPGRTGSNIPPEVVIQLATEIDHVVGVKEASGDIEQVMAIRAGAREDFLILSGDDALTLPMISVGAQGLISVASNEIPKQLSDMVRYARANEWQQARELHYEWLDLMTVNFCETNPQPVKTALALMGHIEETFRLPLVAMEAANKQSVCDVLERHGLLQ